MIGALILAVGIESQAGMSPAASAMVEGRPAPADTSPIQHLVDEASPGATIEIPSGRYVGDLILDRPIHLVGRGRPLFVGSRRGSVIRVRAADVTLEGIDIDGLGGGDLGRDASGVHIAAPRATVRDCRIVNALFGIYLREADGAVVERCTIRGIPGKDAGEKGSGIHIWNTNGFRIVGNDVRDVRDGLYIQSSSNGHITRNVASDLRYGIHYMFSDDNVFEDNLFANGAAGAALMYSKRITFRGNRFVRNRGFASVGLLLKACDDVVAEGNLVADNARGIFLEGSYRNRFRRNIIAESDTAIVLYDSAAQNIFTGNSFVANLTPLSLVGRRTDTIFEGNYWSDHGEPDLDGDGYADRPYRLSSVFDHLRSNLIAADLFTQGIGARALGAAERTFPVLEPIPVEDRRPLTRPPADLGAIITGSPAIRPNAGALLLSVAALVSGGAVLARNRPRRVVR
jgi:nitrous oxidase accessory protein